MGRGENRIKDEIYHQASHFISFASGNKRWGMTGGCIGRAGIDVKQIAEAEEKRKMRYIISVPSGYYEIQRFMLSGEPYPGIADDRSASNALSCDLHPSLCSMRETLQRQWRSPV